MSTVKRLAKGINVALALLLLLGLVTLGRGAIATHRPADKVAVAGSAIEVMTTPLVDGQSSLTETILEGTMKTSTPADLMIQVTLECALLTDITTDTVNQPESEAIATVKVWVEIDGAAVPVSSGDTTEPGRVVFCNRAYRQKVTELDDDNDNHVFEQFLRTRSANAFNWIKLNVGSKPSPHTIKVKAQLTAQVTGAGDAKAIVGKRTLVVEPAKLANDATI